MLKVIMYANLNFNKYNGEGIYAKVMSPKACHISNKFFILLFTQDKIDLTVCMCNLFVLHNNSINII
jgi:hypothetical protein